MTRNDRAPTASLFSPPSGPDEGPLESPDLLQERFLEALAEGDLAIAARILRRCGGLSEATVTILAELLDHANSDQYDDLLYPFRFKLVRRKTGRPIPGGHFARAKIESSIAKYLELEFAKPRAKFDIVMEAASEKYKVGRTRVAEIDQARRKKHATAIKSLILRKLDSS